ncbi:MAG: VWA domain-containing protein [Deltaproteobacteria bacterium]
MMDGGSIDLGWPLALWGLALVALVPLLAWRSRFPMSAGRRRTVTALRMVAMTLAVLAVAAVRIGVPTTELAVGLVIDGSGSVAPEERARVGEDLRAMQAVHDMVAWTPVSGGRASNGGGGADLETQIGVAVSLLPRDRARRLLVATDGRDPHLPRAVQAAAEAGVEVSLLPMGERPTVDAFAVAGVDAPRLLRAEETSDVSVTVHASREANVRVEAFFDGRPALTETHHATRGSSSARLSLRFPEDPGVHELEVAVRGEGDSISANDRWRTLVEVLPKPRVRVYHEGEGSPILATVLRDAGMDVEVATPQQAFTQLAQYDPYLLVIADEIELGDLSDDQQRTLRAWVEEEGGGLVTASFNHAIRRTPRILREIEPIEPPPAQPEPRPLELVIVIDRSSSMSGAPMEQARQSAIAAVRALRRDALVGSVAFSGGADRVIAPVPMSQSEQVVQFIAGIHAEGGTNIAAAVTAANHIMSSDPRYIHHVILISDGESEPQSAIAAAMALAGRGVSITTITIGSYSQLLAEIARIGRGRYHVTNAGGLRSLVVSEAMMRQPPAHRQTPFVMREATHLSMFDGMSFEGAPPITGHALAGLRPGATQVLTATEGMPLLAHWHRGLGQVASWTSATSGSWTDGLRTSPVFRQLFTRLARGMLRTRTVEPPRILIERDPLSSQRRLVTIVSPYVDEANVPVVRLFRGASVRNVATQSEPRFAEELPMEIAGPGVWQASIPTGFTFLVDARLPEDVEPAVAEGDARPYDAELAAFGPDEASLARLAVIGGGALLEAPLAILEEARPVSAMRSLRTPLLALALVLYLLSLLLLRWPDRALATGFEVERSSRIPQPSRRSVPPAETKEAA